MIDYHINKDLNIFLSFLGQATPLKLKNNLRIILGSKLGNPKNIAARKKVGHSY